jgi:hypothetical protein
MCIAQTWRRMCVCYVSQYKLDNCSQHSLDVLIIHNHAYIHCPHWRVCISLLVHFAHCCHLNLPLHALQSARATPNVHTSISKGTHWLCSQCGTASALVAAATATWHYYRHWCTNSTITMSSEYVLTSIRTYSINNEYQSVCTQPVL